MINFKGDFLISYEGLKRRKVRSFLTILAIVIGISSVVALVSLGQGIMNTLNEQFESSGGDIILIVPGSSIFEGLGISNVKITNEDIDVIKKVSGTNIVTGMPFKVARMEYEDTFVYNFVIGMEAEHGNTIFEKNFHISMEKGRYFKEGESREVVVGNLLAAEDNNIFGKKITVGKTMLIEGVPFKVVGYLSKIGNPSDDSQIYITLDDMDNLFPESKGEYYTILVVADKSADIDRVVEDIKDKLRKSRDVDKGEEDFTVQTYKEIMETFTSAFSIVGLVVVGIAAISLLVGSVGVANTMFTAVLERTSEIGTMKAVGATNEDIAFIFMIEAAFLGLIGGIIGIGIGYLMAITVDILAEKLLYTVLTIKISPLLVVGLTIFSVFLGAVSGFLPARRAAKMNLSEALRYE